ncbi:helix-turn-helix domain-containing protein [Flindersiella endophytica]
MSAKKGPTVRAQMLGHALRRLRETSGKTGREVASDLGKDTSTVSRIESGFSPPHEEEVVKLLNIYGVDDESERQVMLRLARDVYRRGWYDAYGDSLDEPLIELSWLESRAVALRSFAAVVLPGLLQTQSYARAIHDAVGALPEPEIERGVEARMLRQQALTRQDPVRYEAVLDEAVLRRPVGGTEVMAGQLEHLLDLIKRPNITLRVLPFAAGAHASPDGGFELVELPSPYLQIGHANTPTGIVYVETEALQQLITTYDRLCSKALDPSESIALMKAVVKEFT